MYISKKNRNFARSKCKEIQNMKRKYLVILLLTLAFAGMRTPAFADGESCDTPIQLTQDFPAQQIWTACEKWYVANTFDLPLAIDFYPTKATDAAPELALDFGCTPGVYDDSILCSLFCKSNSVYISMPHTETPPKSYDEQGNVRYHVEFGEFYRDMLLRQGIDYNVPVYVKVTFNGGGILTMAPDPFNNCMDGPKFMHLGDTVNVKPLDKDRHVIVPYVQWQYDSIRYVWQGEEPCVLAIGNKCNFDPTDSQDATIMDGGVVQPGGQFKVSSELLMRYVSDQDRYPNDAGMYFAKFYSASEGVMKIEKIPAPAPDGGAILLEYAKSTPVYKNDTAQLYAMKSSWVRAMQFTTPTDRVFKMYVGTTADFYTKDAVAIFQFDRTEDGHQLSLFESDMAALWEHKVAGHNYLYVRFECSENTTVLPTLWTPSDCIKKAQRIEPGKQFDVSAKSNTIYGLYYADWKGGDMTIAWTNTIAPCPFYIADTCNVPNSEESPVFYADKAPKKGSITIPTATVDSWAEHVDPDGYLYIRFYSTGKGKITVTTSAPAEEDPGCSPMDSVLTVTAWDSYIWRGTAYTESGTHSETVSHPEGCDTTFTLHLTIHTTSYDSYEATGCDSIKYNGKKYTASGVFADTLFDAAGNRTIMTLNLTVKYATAGEETMTACDSLLWNEVWYKESGHYTYHTTNKAGCDSTATLHLTIHHSYNMTLEDVKACDNYVWGDTTIYDSGTYTRRFKSFYGCDSLVTLTVTIGKSYLDTEDVITAYDSYTWIDGRTYKKSISGPVWDMSTIDGCDSTISLNLTIRHLVTDTFARTLCATELPYEWFGKKYTESGIYSSDTILGKEVGGVYMDTVHTVDLTVIPVSTGDTSAVACGSFTWYGKTYTQSATLTHTLTSIHHCDSIVTLHLTINQPSASEETKRVCDSYEWNGVVYTKSGDYTYKTINKAGCDSTATLHLTVNHASSSELIIEKCERYTSPAGHEYTESGTFIETITNKAGCDSTITIHLTILHDCQQPAEYDTVYFCRGFNKEHEERVSDVLIRRYLPYVYESPAEWDYMEGVMLQTERDRTLMDLARAETNLRNHYVGELTPVERIVWSVRYSDAQAYTPIEAGNQPQWIDAGKLAVQILFRCGEMYNNAYPMDTETVSGEETNGRKILRNGQIIIIRNGQEYNLLGTKIQ